MKDPKSRYGVRRPRDSIQRTINRYVVKLGSFSREALDKGMPMLSMYCSTTNADT